MPVDRPALRYHGSKWRLAPWIISHFPAHVCYVEPFGGGASVLLRKQPSEIEVYNDLDEDVVCFFRVLRRHATALVSQIALTPYARAEAELIRGAPAKTDLERARRLYVAAWQLWGGGRGQWRTGWRFQKAGSNHNPLRSWQRTDDLYAIAWRLKQVFIECDQAERVIANYDGQDTLFYVDPPYPASTRTKWMHAAYQHEMSDADHERLAGVLHNVQGMVLISSYRSAQYDRLYGDWLFDSRETASDMGAPRTECLWMNARAELRAVQPRLPSATEEELE